MSASRRIIIIAGPNGAGKTTFARRCIVRSSITGNFTTIPLTARS